MDNRERRDLEKEMKFYEDFKNDKSKPEEQRIEANLELTKLRGRRNELYAK